MRIGIRFLDRNKLPDEKGQIIKVIEEMYEFLNSTGDENQLEEFYDLVQASLNLLQIRNFTLEEIEKAEGKHIEKLKNRKWGIEIMKEKSLIKVGDIIVFRTLLIGDMKEVGEIKEIIEVKDSSSKERVGAKIYRIDTFDPRMDWIEVNTKEVVNVYKKIDI